ncbi:MAG: hypothetical protein ACFFG0_39945 [Candidatus Thorarchaeota archaeon]
MLYLTFHSIRVFQFEVAKVAGITDVTLRTRQSFASDTHCFLNMMLPLADKIIKAKFIQFLEDLEYIHKV